MATSSVLPVIIRGQYDSGSGFAEMVQEAQRASGQIKRSFDASFAEIGRVAQQAVGKGLTSGGAVNVDVSAFREAAAQATAYRATLEELSRSADALAKRTGDTSASTRLYLQALQAQSNEARGAEQAAKAQLTTYSRLQAELDSSAKAIDRVSESYRALALAQNAGNIAAANAELRNRRFTEFDQGRGVGPGASATSNGAGFSALAAREGFDELRRAEVAAAEVARILEAAHRSTSLEIGRSASSAREAASAFQVMFDAADARSAAAAQNFFNTALGIDQTAKSARDSARVFEEMFAGQDRAAAGAARLAADLELVRRAIDPTRVAQQQLDAELARADVAFEQGAISAREYGLAVNAAADNFQVATTGAKQGTTAFNAVTNSVRAQRVAMVQAGQQMQDIAIQFQAGTRSSTILAQQLPQLAFAFSGVKGRVGAVARFFSGPWSLALVGASALLGTYIDRLIRTDEESDKTKEKTISLTDALEKAARGTDEARKALQEYNEAQENSRDNAEEMIKINLANAAASIQEAIATREKTKALLEFLLADARRPSQSEAGDVRQRGAARLASEIEAELAKQDAKLAELAQTARNLLITDAAREAEAAVDPLKAINNKYDDMAEAAKRAAAANNQLAASLRATLTGIENQRKAELDAAKASGTKPKGDPNSMASFAAAVSGGSVSGRLGEWRGDRAHRGIDIAVPVGTRVSAPQSGVVIEAGTLPGYGNVVYINHGKGTISRLAHLSRIDVSKGEYVEKGAVVGLSGGARGAPGSGNSRGPHLHQELLVNGKPVDPRGARAPVDDAQALQRAASETKKAADQALRLAEFAADAEDRIGRMSESFKDTPPAVAQMLSGLATIDDLASDIDRKVKEGLDPKVADALKAKLEELRPVIENSVNQPFRDMVDAADEARQIDELLIAGKQDEAEVLSRIFDLTRKKGDLTAAQAADIRDIVAGERARSRELEKQNELRQREVRLIEGTRDNLRDTMQSLARGGGIGAIGKMFERQFDLMLENTVDNLFEQVFGDFFRDEKDKALGFDKVREASNRQVDSIKTVTSNLDSMATALAGATGALQSKSSDAANDNYDPFAGIVVVGGRGKTGDKKGGGPLQSKVPATGGDFVSRTTSLVARLFMDADDAKRIGDAFSKGLKSDGAAYGALAGGLIVGQNGSPLGATIGGALGEKLGEKVFTKGFEKLAKGLGDFAGPLGSILGGVAGSLIGSLMTSTPRASATIGGVNGSLGVVSTRGNSAQFRKASEGSAGEAIDTLDRIAEALGATIDASLGSVSIGVRKGKYRVDPSGSGITKTSRGAIDFGEDSAAAIRAATMDLIKDGVLQGLRDSTRRLLQGADDLDKAIKDALDFEGVFTRLKEIKDPVGAALDALNKDFERLIGLFQRAGASTEEFAALEELYGLERAKAIKDASEAMTGPLKDLIADLETGDNGLSLRARRENALSKFNPLADAIRAGQTVDYNEFTDAARTLLEISRELFGSQDEYFATFNDILNLSKTALAGQENVVSIADGAPSPFISVDTVPVVQAVDAQSQMLIQQLSALNVNSADILAAILALGNAGGQQANGTYF